MTTVRDLLTGKKVDIYPEEIVIWPARLEPPHKMHLEYILKLSKFFSKIIIVLGSASTHGDTRHCILGLVRYKMLVSMLNETGLSNDKYVVVPLDDNSSDELWANEMMDIAEKYNASFIAIGNEWIKNIFDRKPQYSITVFDPDLGMPETFRATDVRNAIIKGDLDNLKKMLTPSVLQILLENDCYQGVILSNQNRAVKFLEGRQTVDMVLLVKDIETEKVYVLLGKRKSNKTDFPNILALPGGPINKYEFPDEAIVIVLKEETGLEIKIQDRSFLEAPVKINDIDTTLLTMKMVGIYSSSSPLKAGTMGGSSQCFTIFVEDDIKRFEQLIKKDSKGTFCYLYDLKFFDIEIATKITLAYQHNEMLEKAIYMSKARLKLEPDT